MVGGVVGVDLILMNLKMNLIFVRTRLVFAETVTHLVCGNCSFLNHSRIVIGAMAAYIFLALRKALLYRLVYMVSVIKILIVMAIYIY